ncbi:MAG: DUF4177 domain-containing protein [Arenicella sp.]|mgnify:CR=1 FL=1|jgi:hypothetical protein|nr:DUF4177 domain-containing protein [Arenicella sp.]HAU68285.1 DUF4177 domain-containing protein [Gammaproteobacteria bacterium]
MKEYKVVIYQEGMLGSLVLGQSKVDPVRFSEFLNANADDGWRVITMEKDIRRMLLFFQREAFMVVLERERGANQNQTQQPYIGGGAS